MFCAVPVVSRRLRHLRNPPQDESDPGFDRLTQFNRADELCDAYEREWLEGREPSLDDYLAKAPPAERAGLCRELKAIRSDYEQRLRARAAAADGLATHDLHANLAETLPQAEAPSRIGRYRIDKVLGTGGFGKVFLAYDEQLHRLVGLKVPHPGLLSTPQDAEIYLLEARTVANLDHPSIVPVYDVGSTDDCPCYVVSKYVEGCDLATQIKESRPAYVAAVELVAQVAEALHYAHRNGVVHRDIKPGNILIDGDGRPHVVDFGLALREQNVGTGPKYLGTPAYMSPEQARGEGHRVDGRSDIFSLGVVFYELLTGHRPFHGDTQAELLEKVTNCEPRPLRYHLPTVPRELERICHKAMAQRPSERYSNAQDLAEDLRHFLAGQTVIQSGTTASGGLDSTGCETQPASVASTAVVFASSSASAGSVTTPSSQPIKIVPKGLRSFDAHDADFFIDLLPGPRDRNGLPESLRFWKNLIEETDPSQTFPVGLIYGPSGCGKSSLVKAGLLPRLSADIISVYVEATAEETETRLLNRLRRRLPAIADARNLKETLIALRQGRGIPVGKKVLIVLDQFEQWLHARKESDDTDLVAALRQCDGGRLQCIVMIRDDFWLAVSRFLRQLEVRLVEGQNTALVDLFDRDHARRILAAFGRAFGRLPEDSAAITETQNEFLVQSVAGLAQEGKVICVRLALLAGMMKDKAWCPATLKEVGGTEGVGVRFLDETFSSDTASPEHRCHAEAARKVLQELLPNRDSDIRGHMRTRSQLLDASGYGTRSEYFDTLIRMLDDELRLITPTDPESMEGDERRAPDERTNERAGSSQTLSAAHCHGTGEESLSGHRYYQLTHDYLVHSLREWLARKQKETWRGRAELLLSDRSLTWNSKPQDRLLPSLWEYLNIRLLTDRRQWNESQCKLMHRVRRVHGLRLATAAALLAAATFMGIHFRHTINKRQDATRAEGWVDSLLHANIAQVPQILTDLEPYRASATPRLRGEFQKAARGSPESLHIALALLPADESLVDYLLENLTVCTPAQFPVLRDALLPYNQKISDALWQLAYDEQQEPVRRFQAAAALATFTPQDPRWAQVAGFVSSHLTGAVATLQFGQWLIHVQPASEQLAAPLAHIVTDRNLSAKQREAAALALALYLEDEPDKLVDVILAADEFAEFSPLVQALRPHSDRIVRRLRNAIEAGMLENATEEQRDEFYGRQSLAAVSLVHLGHGDYVWPLLEFAPNPSLRSFIIFHLCKLRSDHNVLAARLRVEPSESVRRALLQALGGLDASRIVPADRARIARHMMTLYQNDPDPGVHASASWAIRQWGIVLPDVPRGRRQRAHERPGWHVNGQGQTFAVIPNPAAHGLGQIDHSFAIAFHEVTVTEFHRFQKDHVVHRSMVPSDDCPVHRVTWYMAAEYCNWLSDQEGISKDQWVYLPNDEGRFAAGMRIKDDYSELSGYRLPTEAEWEYACRAGTTSSFAFGEPRALLGRYAKYVLNAEGHSHPVESLLPNAFGLFDVHGNAWEWCHDVYPDTLTPVRDEDARMLRGGSFAADVSLVLSNYRLDSKPDFQHIRYGLRVARTWPGPVKE
jgi:serine/threonine protein kinase